MKNFDDFFQCCWKTLRKKNQINPANRRIYKSFFKQ